MSDDNNDKHHQKRRRVYKDEVLGRNVMIAFLVDDEENPSAFVGKIDEMKKIMETTTTTTTTTTAATKYLHHVTFTDGDDRWFDLTEKEQSNELTWFHQRHYHHHRGRGRGRGRSFSSMISTSTAAPASTQSTGGGKNSSSSSSSDDDDDDEVYSDDSFSSDEEDEDDDDDDFLDHLYSVTAKKRKKRKRDGCSSNAAKPNHKKIKKDHNREENAASLFIHHLSKQPNASLLKEVFQFLTNNPSGPEMGIDKARTVVRQLQMLSNGKGERYQGILRKYCRRQNNINNRDHEHDDGKPYNVELLCSSNDNKDLNDLIRWSQHRKDAGDINYDFLEYPLKKLKQFRQYYQRQQEGKKNQSS